MKDGGIMGAFREHIMYLLPVWPRDEKNKGRVEEGKDDLRNEGLDRQQLDVKDPEKDCVACV